MSAVYDCSKRDSRADGLAAAAGAVRSSRLVVLPTDTVYGIGCDAFDSGAVESLLRAKNRGPDMPVGVLVGSWSTVDGLVLGVPPQARALIEAFWPGDLSIVLPHAPSLQWNLGQSRGTVMLRMPLHLPPLWPHRRPPPSAPAAGSGYVWVGQRPASTAGPPGTRSRPQWSI